MTKSKRRPKVGDTITAHAADGHLRVYTVIGHYPDGYPRTRSFDARHSPKCRCLTSEDW